MSSDFARVIVAAAFAGDPSGLPLVIARPESAFALVTSAMMLANL